MNKEAAIEHLENCKLSFGNKYSPSKITTYQYWASVSRIIDADTLELIVSLGFNITLKERFRLIGINCPETYGVKKTSEEYARGMEALDFVRSKISQGDWVEVIIFFDRREKYGRWLCEVWIESESLNVDLLHSGHAIPIGS